MSSPNYYLHSFTRFFLFAIVGIGFFMFWNIDKVLAINNCNDGWQIAVGQTKQINCHGVCKKVTNNCSKAIFVPTKTSSEWSEFRINHPSCVSLSNCITCTDECSYTGQTQYRCSGDWVQRRTCGDYDADPCLEWSSWSNYENCASKPTDCGYGSCDSDERPDWYCSGGSCHYSCYYDSSCAGPTCTWLLFNGSWSGYVSPMTCEAFCKFQGYSGCAKISLSPSDYYEGEYEELNAYGCCIVKTGGNCNTIIKDQGWPTGSCSACGCFICGYHAATYCCCVQ